MLGDEKTLFPIRRGLIEAAKILIKEGFIVLPYTNDDPIVAKKLVDILLPAVMPLAAPIGSGLGIRNPYNENCAKMEPSRYRSLWMRGLGPPLMPRSPWNTGPMRCSEHGHRGRNDPIAMAEAMKYAHVRDGSPTRRDGFHVSVTRRRAAPSKACFTGN